jgi:hypothetical protein
MSTAAVMLAARRDDVDLNRQVRGRMAGAVS